MSRPWTIPKFVTGDSGRKQNFETDDVLHEARRKADELRGQIIREARQEAVFLRDQAGEEGFAEGYAEGEKKARLEWDAIVLRQKETLGVQLEQLIAEREKAWEDLTQQLSTHLHEIALCCCEKLFAHIPSEHALPREHILRAVQSISDGNLIQLRVHPDNQEGWPSHLPLEIVPDPALSERDFLLSGEAGLVDGTWETRWSAIKSILEESSCD